MVRKSRCLAGEIDEHFLGDVLRPVTIAPDVAQLGSVHEVHMAAHQLGKSLLLSLVDEAAE
jgi:hypothetical protein